MSDDVIATILVTTVVEAVNLKKTYMLGKVPVNALLGVNLKVESGDARAFSAEEAAHSWEIKRQRQVE